MTIQDLEKNDLILLKVRSGSHAYGLATPTSDEDFRGVFYLPRDQFFGLEYVAQVSDATNDEVYYELGRFLELLTKANPTALEVLATPNHSILLRHSIMDRLNIDHFLSQQCRHTFAGYATTQIRKARGLNKKVHNPMAKERKAVEHFCYIITDGQSLPLIDWSDRKQIPLKELALVRVDHTRGVYAIYHDGSNTWAEGVSSGPNANDVSLSSVPKGERCLAYLSFNKDGYSVYCKNYREYWKWVADRNDDRYESTLAHGQGYDAKNMMHTIRLLDMVVEIFRDGALHVERPDRDFLLSVKAGNYPLEEVLEMAETRLVALAQWAGKSLLPKTVDPEMIERLLVEMREELYTVS
jgi:hypothetical protein